MVLAAGLKDRDQLFGKPTKRTRMTDGRTSPSSDRSGHALGDLRQPAPM